MNFAFSDEQEELRTAVRRFLAEKSPETEVRRLMETDRGLRPGGVEPDGRPARPAVAHHPRGVRRVGLHLRRAARRARGDGRRAAVRAVLLVRGAGGQRAAHLGRRRGQEGLLPGIASGETIATLALTEDNGRWDFSGIELAATKTGDGWVLNGHKMFVLDGHVANLIVVAARTAAGRVALRRQGRRRRA